MPIERGFDGHTSAAYAPMIADPRSKQKSTRDDQQLDTDTVPR